MTTHRMLLAAGLLLALLLAASFLPRNADSQQNSSRSPRRWQHMALTHEAEKGIQDPLLRQQMVQLGREGWELVATETIVRDGRTTHFVFFFKMPL